MFIKVNKKIDILYYALLLLTLTLLLSTNPFLKYPFDVYIHLHKIDTQYNITSIPNDRLLWHWIWAKLFHLLHIDSTKVFLRAYIIHYLQILITFSSIFYFSYVFIKNIFHTIDKHSLKYMALWSTNIWFIIYATQSMGIHQVWFLWYSITYQITLPIVMVMLAITITIIFEYKSNYNKIIYFIIIIILGRFVLQMHAMELLYYLMYISILLILFIDYAYKIIKNNIIFSFLLFLSFYLSIDKFISFFLNYSEIKSSRIISYLSFDKIPQLYNQIMRDGYSLIRGLNRAYASMNELIYLSIILVIILGIVTIYNYIKKRDNFINYRLVFFLIITSLFVLIPLFQFTSGLAGMLVSSIYVVNRFYYSSLIFLVIPIFTYYILQVINKQNIIYLNIYVLSIIFSVFLYSKYDSNHHQNYYKNIQSIKNSFYRKKVGFNLSSENIKKIGKLKTKYKYDLNISESYFFAREDIGFILKNIYNVKVYLPSHYNGAALDINYYIKAYNKSNKKNKILFELPKDFPKYVPYR